MPPDIVDPLEVIDIGYDHADRDILLPRALQHGDRLRFEGAANFQTRQRIALRIVAHRLGLIGQRGPQQDQGHQDRSQREPDDHHGVERGFAVFHGGHLALDHDRDQRADEELEGAHREQEEDRLVEQFTARLAGDRLRSQRKDQPIAGVRGVEPRVVIRPEARPHHHDEAEPRDKRVEAVRDRLAVARADTPDHGDGAQGIEQVHRHDRRDAVGIGRKVEDEKTGRACEIAYRYDRDPPGVGFAAPQYQEGDTEHHVEHGVRQRENILRHATPRPFTPCLGDNS